MTIKTFYIQTLGCRVNQYESEQLAALLRSRGLAASDDPRAADLRIINTCSVTVQAAGKSRQAARRAAVPPERSGGGHAPRRVSLSQLPAGPHPHASDGQASPIQLPIDPTQITGRDRSRVIVTGCWATSDSDAAAALPGVDAVLGHHHDVAAELARLLESWQGPEDTDAAAQPSRADANGKPLRGNAAGGGGVSSGSGQSKTTAGPRTATFTPTYDLAQHPSAVAGAGGAVLRGAVLHEVAPKPSWNDGWIDQQAGSSAGDLGATSKAIPPPEVNRKLSIDRDGAGGGARDERAARAVVGTRSLPLLGERQTGRQRAFLKVQDGCDAHCTYCIIPTLRPAVWSKPPDDAVEEANRLVAAGHVELVLTGIFLGAYGHPTALRRRQSRGGIEPIARLPIARLIDALCTRVPGLRRLRLSSLEPGDLTDDLIAVLRSHRQVVPHFHLPLQSGSDLLLRRMNRQYTRGDFYRMIDHVRAAFDRPALTTDVIVGFPGETNSEFERTVEAVDHAGFIHVHAFSFSPRPGTAAARWTGDFVRGPIVNERISRLRARAHEHSFAFRGQFLGEVVELLVEQESEVEGGGLARESLRHGRCERYFPVHFDAPDLRPGDFVRVRVDDVGAGRTLGTFVGACS